MQEQDIQAWERELSHTQMMQKQREGSDGKQVGTIRSIDAKKVPPVFLATVALAWGKGAGSEK